MWQRELWIYEATVMLLLKVNIFFMRTAVKLLVLFILNTCGIWLKCVKHLFLYLLGIFNIQYLAIATFQWVSFSEKVWWTEQQGNARETSLDGVAVVRSSSAPFSVLFCYQYCCCSCSFTCLIAVPSKKFLSQPIIPAPCLSQQSRGSSGLESAILNPQQCHNFPFKYHKIKVGVICLMSLPPPKAPKYLK